MRFSSSATCYASISTSSSVAVPMDEASGDASPSPAPAVPSTTDHLELATQAFLDELSDEMLSRRR